MPPSMMSQGSTRSCDRSRNTKKPASTPVSFTAARQYSVNGERRTYALLRPANGDATRQDRLREMVLQAYADFEQDSDAGS